MKKYIQLLSILFLFGNSIYAQKVYKKTSIRVGVGLGINESKREIGSGRIYSIGWQNSFGKKDKLRINPNLIYGSFSSRGITDTPDMFYRISQWGLNIHYDLIRYKSLSVVTTGGGFVNYSRGLIGTGGWPEANNDSSAYLYSLYLGGNLSLGLRIDEPNSRFAYEFRPFNIHFGTKYFSLAYLMFGIDIKLRKN